MLKTLKPLRYVFYRILTWKLRDPRENMPVLTACLATSLLLFCNLMLVILIVNTWRGNRPLPGLHRGPIEYVSVGVVLIIAVRLMYGAWVDKGKLDSLTREFSHTQGARSPSIDLLSWGYIVFTVIAPFALAIWLGHARQSVL